MSLSTSSDNVSCRLVHHGAAASSCSHSLIWIPSSKKGDTPSSMVVYSSHGIVNVAYQHTAVLAGGIQEPVWNVESTLRTSTVAEQHNKRVITCLTHVRPIESRQSVGRICLATGFSDGTINTWWQDVNGAWEERVLMEQPTEKDGRAVTDIDGLLVEESRVMLVMCTSDGAFMLLQSSTGTDQASKTHRLASFAANAVRVESMPFDRILILVGTAHPRHNKIHLYTTNLKGSNTVIHHCGHLSGHQDWITCFDWHMGGPCPILASASQDAKIRLWRFATTTVTTDELQSEEPQQHAIFPTLSDDDASDAMSSDADDDEEEARLELLHGNTITRVSLEALLLGHEEAVTSVRWHPNPSPYYGQEYILISSSMDRTLLIWGPTDSGSGVWTPLTRVGSAGGILGGSVGSSLLGFVNAAMDPIEGRCLLGHAYGGALHFWGLVGRNKEGKDNDTQIEEPGLPIDEMASRSKWRATPCLTGHFQGITDMCWEAESGDYLLTVSVDQTCRLWGPVQTNTGKEVWVELARPQVHGYDLNAVTSVSTSGHRHLIVSGADEKELRVFDAPQTTVRMLQAVRYGDVPKEEEDTTASRVERAYIPSLGLSNKATAGDSPEEDVGGGTTRGESDWDIEASQDHSIQKLPLERDLGVISLWPEVRKLFGHNTELYCLTSTVSACSGPKWPFSPFSKDVLVASSAKARDVDAASIRIWDVEQGKCIQVLSGGHRSTVAALSFSPDGHYLASSGKDRRLCLWRREHPKGGDCVDGNDADKVRPTFTLTTAVDSAHKRIVWAAHFCPSDPAILASGSRDGCIKVWKVLESNGSDKDGSSVQVHVDELHSLEPSTRVGKKADSVTALAFAPRVLNAQASETQDAVLAVGVESGFIELWRIPIQNVGTSSCNIILCVPSTHSHFSSITKLAWKPVRDEKSDDSEELKMTLASSSMDHGCRIFELRFNS